MTTRVQAFDSVGYRLSDPGFGEPGVKSWNGLTGVVKGTLAEIYGFGLGDSPSADNLFAMPSGNRRWADTTSTSNALATVSDAFWETANATADRRVGPWLARRWVTGGQSEAAFRTDILFDSTYVGNPIERSWVLESAFITSNGSEAGVTGDGYATRKFSLHNFFGGQPASFPSPGLLTGAYSSEQTLLYNGGGFGNFKTARLVTGWGQNFAFAQPQRAGSTPGYVAVYDPATTADAIGNGTGFWCGWGTASSFTPDQFTGGLGLTMLALDVNGAYRAGLWARADHTTVNEVAGFDNTIAWTSAPLFSGGPTVDPFAGVGMGGFFSNAPTDEYAFLANESTAAAASTNLALFSGSWNGAVGAFSAISLYSPNAVGSSFGNRAPQALVISHAPTATAPFDIFNGRGPLRFGGGNGAAVSAVLQIDNTNHLLQFLTGLTAPGAVAVAITNAPAGVAATPVEYIKVEGTGGATRYIPLLG